jgi:hypothetical protein
MTYNRIVLALSGVAFTKTMLTRILGKINGKIFYDITGDQLDALNKYKGIFDAAGFLTIDFTEPRSATLGGQYAGAIGTAQGVNSLTFELTIGAANAPILDSWSVVTEPMALGPITSIMSYPVSIAAAGKFPVSIPFGPGTPRFVKRLLLFSTVVTQLSLKKNGMLIFEEVPTAVNEFEQKEYKLVPQANLYIYDAIMNGDLSRVLELGAPARLGDGSLNPAATQSFEIQPTVSGAGIISMLAERLCELNTL